MSSIVTPLPVLDKMEYVFIETDSFVTLPPVKTVFLSFVAGGGAGGYGDIVGKLALSGGGGGSGFGCKRFPINLVDPKSIIIDCKIGKGGDENNQNGGDTVIKVISDGNTTTLTAGGGMGGGKGEHNQGGLGGKPIVGMFSRANSGLKGSCVISTYKHIGGIGGASEFYNGGRGVSYNIQDLLSSNGKWGSGGGGMIPAPGRTTISKGGDGFVLIEYTM